MIRRDAGGCTLGAFGDGGGDGDDNMRDRRRKRSSTGR